MTTMQIKRTCLHYN